MMMSKQISFLQFKRALLQKVRPEIFVCSLQFPWQPLRNDITADLEGDKWKRSSKDMTSRSHPTQMTLISARRKTAEGDN
jgi:hypothetical protein